MKILFTLSCLIVISGCAGFKPSNSDICVKDSPGHEHCAYTIQGNDFDIDNGANPYTLNGQHLSADAYDNLALRISPWTYAAEKKNILNYCHAHPKDCSYSQVVQRFTDLENTLNIDRSIVPEWSDSMLDLGEDQ